MRDAIIGGKWEDIVMAVPGTTGPPQQIASFAEELFGHLPRADQRHWALTYLRGLLAAEGRKSVRRLASAVSESPTAAQSLQQFVNVSPWAWAPARSALTRWSVRRAAPTAWTAAPVMLPKRGSHSVGVHRRTGPAGGRPVSCQLGLALFLSTGQLDVPVDWQLMLPGPWAEDVALRRRARVPDDVLPRPAWAQVLDMTDRLAVGTGPAAAPVVADLSTFVEDATPLVAGLSRRGRHFLLTVPGSLPVTPAGGFASRTAGALELLHSGGHALRTAARSGRLRPAHITTSLVRLPGVPGPSRTCRLFTEVRPAGGRVPRVWLTDLPHRRVDELLPLTECTASSATAVRRLEDFGLFDLEGRSFPGWHHHMTLVSAAYAYSRLACQD
ncbi:IS701 family transposase [Streptomyces sp. NBC_00859]|uniref:IS701 family transposase n=1 Tax=Streptomyces sp. NBC_00859 TaxID=2903682 RepID=UPI003867F8B9|nr:transposase [Streptomyces sp. NBC_00859]